MSDRPHARAVDRVTGMLRGRPAPIAWKAGIDATLALGVGMAVGALVNTTTAVLTGVTACLIGMAGGQYSLRVGLRNVAAIDARDIDAQARLGLENVRWGLADARAFLEGRSEPRKTAKWPSPARMVTKAVLDPDGGWFRYGIQRAVLLGLGVLAFKLLVPDADEQAFWVLLTVFVVVQPNQVATARTAIQRSAGTFAGALLAALMSLAVPPVALVPYVAGAMLILAVALGARNPTISAGLYGAFMAVMIGVPASDVPEWAFWRAVATAVGCVLALALASVVLPARSRPRECAAAAWTAIGDALDALAAYCRLPGARDTGMPLSARQAIAAARLERLASERTLLHDRSLRKQFDDVTEQLRQANYECDAMVLLGVRGREGHYGPLVRSGIDRVTDQLTRIEPLIEALPRRG